MRRRSDNDSGTGTSLSPAAGQAAVARWLAAERLIEGPGEEAPRSTRAIAAEAEVDEALGQLFHSLPAWAPAPGFARRVMERVERAALTATGVAPRRQPVPWTLRGLALAALVAAAALLVLIPSALRPLLAATGLGEVGLAGGLGTLAAAVNGIGQFFASLLSWWQKAVRLAGGAAALADSPAAIALALSTLMSGAYALRLLDQVLTRQRSLRHARF